MRDRLDEQTPHVRAFDASTEHDLRYSEDAGQIDFRLSWPGDMDMSRFMVERVNDEPEAMCAVNDDHGAT